MIIRRSSLTTCFATLILLAELGCGGSGRSTGAPNKKAEVPEQPLSSVFKNSETKSNPAEALGLQIILEAPAGADPRRPDPRASLLATSSISNMIVIRNEIILVRKLFLPDPNSADINERKEIFFVWPENSLSSPIQYASYNHRVIDNQDHHIIASQGPILVGHDFDAGRWYIRISDLFKELPNYLEANIDCDHLQELSLELVLEKGPNTIIQIKFHVAAPLPRVEHQSSPSQVDTTPENFIKVTSNDGWILHDDRIHNPTAQPLMVWMKKKFSNTPLSLTTYISRPRFEENTSARPSGPFMEFFSSTAEFELSEIVVEHGNGEKEIFPIIWNEWVNFTLRSSETLIINWVAKRKRGIPNCSLPLGQELHFKWIESQALSSILGPGTVYQRDKISKCIPKDQPPPVRSVPQTLSIPIHWNLGAAKLVGDWDKIIRLTYPFTPRETATQEVFNGEGSLRNSNRNLKVLSDQSITSSISYGDIPISFDQFPCQGVFR